MWTRLSKRQQRISSGRAALAALVAFIVFSVLVLPGQWADVQEQSGGAGSPDMSLLYSPSDLYQMAEAHGQKGRDAYVWARWTFDLVFPLVYGAALLTALGWLCARVFAPGSLWQRANLAPVLGVFFDYLENASTSLVMLRYPDKTPVVELLAPVFTLTKWAFVGAGIVLLLSGAIIGVRRWVQRKGPW